MTPQEVLAHFGSQAEIARVLGCKQPSVAEWFEKGEVPEGRQYQLQIATDGVLQADKPANRHAAADES
jgi:predicted XRE-type DNA-binding protein